MDTCAHPVSSKTRKLIRINGRCSIGATGAVSSVTGAGCTVSRLGVGKYLIDLEDGFNRFINANVTFGSPFSGDANDGSFVVGTAYKIKTIGTTDFSECGANEETVGDVFVATATGSGGDGVATALSQSGIFKHEVATFLVDNAVQDKYGIIIHTMNASGTDTDPTEGSVMFFSVDVRNTAVKEKGES